MQKSEMEGERERMKKGMQAPPTPPHPTPPTISI